MSQRQIGSVISALVTLLIFVGIPYLLPSYMPPDIAQMMTDAGIEIPEFLNYMKILG
ncbi:MAG: hypothetical protein GTO63_27780, partial [Anaerolineae bacterium]|nr:hypothetical protein [Anaerolineae bacterium]NIN98536.1 hypothetical protein [Anaerolineae bacterium]NIQ81432.1 hypothetical protein [Anaerolineae bacterium]